MQIVINGIKAWLIKKKLHKKQDISFITYHEIWRWKSQQYKKITTTLEALQSCIDARNLYFKQKHYSLPNPDLLWL